MSFQYTPFGGQMLTASPQVNRRATVRYQCALATAGRLVIDRTEFRRAWVIDIGSHGVGLILTKTMATGQQLVVQLKSSMTGKVYLLPAQVIHTTPQPNGDWRVGCAFGTPLTAEQLDELL